MDSYLQEALNDIRNATDGMTTEELAWHPDGKWSAAEILEHLSLTFSGTAKGMRRALSDNAAATQKRTLKSRIAALLVAEIGYFPTGRKSPEMAVPRTCDAGTAVHTILANLAEMDAVLSDVESRKGPNTRLPHPVIGPLTIRQWRKFHRVHTRHHMKQIARLRQMQRNSSSRSQ